jgi:hypothetical protein
MVMTGFRVHVHYGRSIMLALIITAGLVSIIGTGSNTRLTMTTACVGGHQYVRTGSLVVLDGRCSDFTDAASDQAYMLYYWEVVSRPSGSMASIGGYGNSVLASFVADRDGEYEIKLSTRVAGYDEATTIARVTATTGNARPMAEAGSYQEVAIGDTVQLQGGASDADGDSVSYAWSLSSGSEPATLSAATSTSPTFVANTSGDYGVDLVANDGAVDSLVDSVLIRARDVVMTLPVAVAGADQTVTPGDLVTLDGHGSYSAYGKPLSYRWRMIARPLNSLARLSDITAVQPSFTADLPGDYVLRLMVNDGVSDSSRSLDGINEDRLIVTAVSNQPPIADGGGDHMVNTGTPVMLDGSGSSDPENATLTYSWTLIKQPDGSSASLSSVDTQSTQLTPERDGDYLVQLVVNDGVVDSAPDVVRVSASSLSGATSLVVVNSLPFAPSDVEVATWVQVDTDDSDTIRITSPVDEIPGNFATAIQVTYSSATAADFSAFPGWSIISPVVLTIDDATTPIFIVQRIADGVYYKIVPDFTSLEGTFTVQVDGLQAWRCGTNPADCP